MVAVCLLHGLCKLGPHNAVLLGNRAEALSHATLHALQAAHVDMGLFILHHLPELFSILGHLCLDVHLLSSCVLVLTAHRIVVFELIRVLLLVGLMLIIVQQGLRVWHTHEKPSKTLELATSVFGSASLVVEEQPQVGAHGRNASACCKHDDVGLWVLRQQHLRTSGAGDEHLVSGCHIANVVGANSAVDLVVWEGSASLVRLVLSLGSVAELTLQLHDSLHTQGNSLGGLIISHCGGGNGVETDLGWLLTFLVRARCNDTDRLPLNVRHLATVIKGHMSGLPVGITSGLCQSLWVEVVLNDLALVRCLWGEQVPGNLLAMHHLDALFLHRCGSAAGHPCHSSHHSHAAHGTLGRARHLGASGTTQCRGWGWAGAGCQEGGAGSTQQRSHCKCLRHGWSKN
mmetsp:Transcript_70254/g.86199  ORF Transcript_70254/g.86199 Transcript_70254/m.86199 type:complete len:401 (-) Transcript_70254:53-1255(-)